MRDIQRKKQQCTGKLRYRDMNEAQMEIDRAELYRGEILRAYLCDKCRQVHLTSQPLESYKRFNPRNPKRNQPKEKL